MKATRVTTRARNSSLVTAPQTDYLLKIPITMCFGLVGF